MWRASMGLSMLVYLLLVRLYGRDEALTKEWGLFKLKECFAEEIAQENAAHTALKLKW